LFQDMFTTVAFGGGWVNFSFDNVVKLVQKL
jgi:hypothetical protein